MIVLQVIPELSAGGAERTTVDVAAALARVGGTALVASQGGRLERELKSVGGELRVLPMSSKNPATMIANAFRLADIARHADVDVIHARSRAPAWSALFAARMADRPFVTTYHGTYNASSALKRFYNSVMARGDVVIANSEFIAERIRSEHGSLAKEIVVIPRGVDTRAFDPAAVSAERVDALRARWGLEGAGRVVLMPGRLTRWKGQLLMIEAFARLRSLEGDSGGVAAEAVLVMPGDDQGRAEYRAELEGAIAVLGLGEAVRLPGHAEDMAAAYALADVVVSASIEPEAFGRVAAEAGCMGRPVIATDHGGSRETVLDGEGGRLVAPGDVGAMAAALGEVLAMTPAARIEMGRKAAERARALFSVEALQAATLRVYDEVAARAGR
ncbi:MAG: glycosyltransferase family 4 protein [Maricaulaceae bacterium]|jgi:glycosyltransferase involved in cell wall biosynthesis